MKTRFNCLVVGVLIPLMLTSGVAQEPNADVRRSGETTSLFEPQQSVARLTTTGRSSATVNGASAASGTAVLSGATIRTPDQVSAKVDLGPLGTIDLGPNSFVRLDFSDDGSVRVEMFGGCAAIMKQGAGDAEVYTAEGASERIRSSKAKGFCYADGKLNPNGSLAGNSGVKRRKVKFPWCVFVLKC